MVFIIHLTEYHLYCLHCTRAVNLYLEWHVVKSLISYLSRPFREAKKEFSEVLSGQQQITLNFYSFQEIVLSVNYMRENGMS